MICRDDLRKVLWPGRACLVAADAQQGGIQFGWRYGRVGGVVGERSVTGFAMELCMLAGGLHRYDIGMTCLAGFVAGKVNRPSCYVADCVSAIVAVLPEAARNHEAANSPEHQKADDKQRCKPVKM